VSGLPQVCLGRPRCAQSLTPPLPHPQVTPASPLEPKPPAPMGDGQLTWRRRRHSPHFPLCSFCCRCCRNRGCGFCCRT
ncbi:HEPC2 protein, partial [Sylvietta virens]|nr:HEPC2 protein [Sylvietta virens]